MHGRHGTDVFPVDFCITRYSVILAFSCCLSKPLWIHSLTCCVFPALILGWQVLGYWGFLGMGEALLFCFFPGRMRSPPLSGRPGRHIDHYMLRAVLLEQFILSIVVLWSSQSRGHAVNTKRYSASRQTRSGQPSNSRMLRYVLYPISLLLILRLLEERIPDGGPRISTPSQFRALEHLPRAWFPGLLLGLLLPLQSLLLPPRRHVLHELPAELLRQPLVRVTAARTLGVCYGGFRVRDVVYIH